MRCSLLPLLLAGVLAAAGPAAAQELSPRKGFFISVGAGFGSLGFSGDSTATPDRLGGLSGNLRLGGTIDPHWRLGVMTAGWTG
ncbi:MAG TPA: hypothetical protein VL295_05340, partial [Gemmatimonadales bacterium]|nr:hypothetical protein [Gemmatimonadales bacterium]